VDFHQRLTGDPATARERIARALQHSGLALSGISLANNYNQAEAGAVDEQLDASRLWIDIAADLNTPVCRVFGGGRSDDPRDVQFDRTVDALRRIAEYAAKRDVQLALENHGGIPLTGEEQVAMIDAVGSDFLSATIDVGNYLHGGQEGVDGTRVAAARCRYVHFKDFMKIPSDEKPWGWAVRACTVGVGEVDHEACLAELHEAGYRGWVALEYEGRADERIGVEESIYFMNRVLAKVV